MPKMNLVLMQICNLLIGTTTASKWNFAGVNIALGMPTNQSPGTYENYISALAVDGKTNVTLQSGTCSHTGGQFNTPASWTVDLKCLFTLKGIRLYPRGESHRVLDRHKNFRIIGLPSRSILHDDSTANPPLYRNLLIEVAVTSPQQFSSVSVEVPPHTSEPDDGFTYLQLCEVQIYAEDDDCPMPSSGGQLVMNVRQGTGYWKDDKSLVSSGSVLDFSCNDYYTLVGNISVTCKRGGVYNSKIPTCIAGSDSDGQCSLNTAGIAGGASVGGIVVGAFLAVVVMLLLLRKRNPPPEQTQSPSIYMTINPAVTDGDNVYSDLGQT